MKEKTEMLAVGSYSVTWIRKPIKRLHLRIEPPNGEIVLSSPMRLSRADAVRFVSENLAWIEAHRPRCLVKASPPSLEEGELVPLFGGLYRLRILEGRRASASVVGDAIVLTVSQNDRAHRAAALKGLYRAALAARAEGYFERLAQRTALKPSAVAYRRMKSKWGSCRPSSGAINLNLYLALYEADCLEYVILHELVHLRHANHSKEFYATLEGYMPDWKDRARRLSEAASALAGRLPI